MATPTIAKQVSDNTRALEMHIREEAILKKQLMSLRKEIDIGLYDYLKIEGVEKSEAEKTLAQGELNRRMETELEDVIVRRNELLRQVEALKGEKELKV